MVEDANSLTCSLLNQPESSNSSGAHVKNVTVLRTVLPNYEEHRCDWGWLIQCSEQQREILGRQWLDCLGPGHEIGYTDHIHK